MKLFITILFIVADVVATDQRTCYGCVEEDAAKCTRKQIIQVCSSSPYSLGTSHCASMTGKALDSSGKVVDLFYRGCIDCSGKKVACFALGGYFKGGHIADDRHTLQKCEIECCDGNNCNNVTVPFTQYAINVFAQAASGPKQCNRCLEDNATECSNNQHSENCTTDPTSLGTTHCGSAAGKYRDREGNVVKKYIRGCINCADKKAACATVGGFLNLFKTLTQLECEMECCTGDNCNTQFPSKDGSPTSLSTPAKQDSHRVLLAFATALGHIFYYF